MEWILMNGKTVDEAKELALDQLGVEEADAEIEIVEEPRTGLFGRLRGQAQIRARVRPAAVRPKVERQQRRRKRDGNAKSSDERGSRSSNESNGQKAGPTNKRNETSNDKASEESDSGKSGRKSADQTKGSNGSDSRQGNRRSGRGGNTEAGSSQSPGRSGQQKENNMPELTIDEQSEVVADFLRGLADCFGESATATEIERVDDSTVEIRLTGGDLGLMIGPKGQTLQLIQELARTTVQRRGGGIQEGRIRIDIAGYRARRRDALERFTTQIVADVVATGTSKALEPMNPADRKVVHDTAGSIGGVRTLSEGDEPQRRVVITPLGS